MKTILRVLLLIAVAAVHAVYLFVAYGTGFFGIAKSLPYMLVIALWLGASSALAGIAYFWILRKVCAMSSVNALIATFVLLLGSLYVGVVFAFNTYGT